MSLSVAKNAMHRPIEELFEQNWQEFLKSKCADHETFLKRQHLAAELS